MSTMVKPAQIVDSHPRAHACAQYSLVLENYAYPLVLT
jgi:hypothetical protein